MTANIQAILSQPFATYLDELEQTIDSKENLKKETIPILQQIALSNFPSMLESLDAIIDMTQNSIDIEMDKEILVVSCQKLSQLVHNLVLQVFEFKNSNNKTILEKFIYAKYKVHYIVQHILTSLESEQSNEHYQDYLEILERNSFGDSSSKQNLESISEAIKTYYKKNKNYNQEALLSFIPNDPNNAIKKRMNLLFKEFDSSHGSECSDKGYEASRENTPESETEYVFYSSDED